MRFLTILLFTFSIISGANARELPPQVLGAGIVLGSPSALTAKYWLDSKNALDFGLAFSFNDYALFYSDYLLHSPGVFKTNNPYLNEFVFYWGLGAVLVVAQKDRITDDGYIGKKSGSFGLGVRAPLGLEWIPRNTPMGIFLEVAPGLSAVPATSSFIQGGLGLRYYF